MEGTILHTDGHHADAVARVVHDEVGCEVLDEELGAEAQRAPIQRVEHRVASAVGSASATVGLASLAIVQGLTAERALVDFPLLSPAEGQAVVLELEHCSRSLESQKQQKQGVRIAGHELHSG